MLKKVLAFVGGLSLWVTAAGQTAFTQIYYGDGFGPPTIIEDPVGPISVRGNDVHVRFGSLETSVKTVEGSLYLTAIAHDWLTIDGGTLNGQQGFARVAIDYGWNFGASGARAEQSALLRLDFGATSPEIRELRNRSCDEQSCVSTIQGPTLAIGSTEQPVGQGRLVLDLPIEFGSQQYLGMGLQGMTMSEARDGTASSSFVAGMHAYWDGIVQVTDAAGQIVPYTLLSASGTNYATSLAPTAVPEPASLVLMGLGLGVLLLGKRRLSE